MKRELFLIMQIIVLLLACWARADELKWPDSRAAHIAKGYIDSYNAQDVDAMREFAATYRTEAALAERSAQARAERRMGFFEQLGALKPVVITEHSDYTITVTCHAEKVGMWMRMTVKLQEQEPYKLSVVEMAPTSPPDTGSSQASETVEWDSLAQLLAIVCEQSGIPGMAAAIVEDGRIVDAAVAGVRMASSRQEATLADRWHIGSITKAMTATVVGAAVESGAINWNSTVGDILDDIDMKDAYRDVTVEQLLRHRGGVQPHTQDNQPEEARLAALTGSPTEQRRTFVAEVLREAPVGDIGAFEYSNAGYAVVGYMTERATGMSWEALMQAHVFTDMEAAGFGWGATPDRPNQPRGHYAENDSYRPQEFGEYELGAYIAPAGDVHMSITDLAAFATMHLSGLAGRDGAISAETIQYLHSTDPEQEPGYACGWMVVKSENVVKHAHGGSAGTMLAHLEVYPDSGRAIAITMNVGLEGMGAVQEIVAMINERWAAADPVANSTR